MTRWYANPSPAHARPLVRATPPSPSEPRDYPPARSVTGTSVSADGIHGARDNLGCTAMRHAQIMEIVERYIEHRDANLSPPAPLPLPGAILRNFAVDDFFPFSPVWTTVLPRQVRVPLPQQPEARRPWFHLSHNSLDLKDGDGPVTRVSRHVAQGRRSDPHRTSCSTPKGALEITASNQTTRKRG